MSEKPDPVSPEIFSLLSKGDLTQLFDENVEKLLPFLPCLMRIALCPSVFSGVVLNETIRNELRSRLLPLEKANNLISLMACDFLTLENDLRKDLKIKRKNLHYAEQEIKSGTFNRFESSVFSVDEKYRSLLSDIFLIKLFLSEGKQWKNVRKFEPLDNLLTFEDCSYLLCISVAEMKSLCEIEPLTEALLRYKYGPNVIERLVSNFPDTYYSVISALIQKGDALEEDSFIARKRFETLEILVKLNVEFSYQLLSLCLSARKLPSTLFHCGLKFVSFENFTSLLCGIFFGTDIQQRIWLVHFIQSGQKSRPGSLQATIWTNFKQKLIQNIQNFLKMKDTVGSDAKYLQHAINLIRLICALRSLANAKLADEEIRLIFEFISLILEPSALSAKFIVTSLCYLLSFPPSGSQNVEYENIINWLKRLIEKEQEFSSYTENYAKMLLLIAINFHSNQFTNLSQMVSNVLRLKIQLKSNQLVRLRTIFTQDLYPEQLVTEHASKMAVTKNLNVSLHGYLPIHCVQQLLSSRMFSKHKVVIKDWIIAQLKECTTPIHPSVPALLEAYCNSCILPLTKSSQHQASAGNAPLDEKEIMAFFDGNVFEPSFMACRILVLYYALLHDEITYANLRNIAIAGRSAFLLEKVFDVIPVVYYFNYVENHLLDFHTIYSNFVRLTMNQFPYLFLTTSIKIRQEIGNCQNLTLDLSPNDLFLAIKNWRQNPSKSVNILKKCSKFSTPDYRTVEFIESFSRGLPELLANGVPGSVLDPASSLFNIYEDILPRNLYLSILYHLLPQKIGSNSFIRRKMTHLDLCDDPLIVLRCDERIFRCAPILKILLRILRCYLNSGRVHLHRQLTLTTFGVVNNLGSNHQNLAAGSLAPYQPSTADAEREELVRALIGAQESASVQILLEACLPTPLEKDNFELMASLNEIREIIFSHLHQMFLTDPMLMKLVHFQGYPVELLPLTVSRIPSMHVCLDFIPEMLSQPDHSKRVFGIILLSHLGEQYSIPKAFGCSKLAINVLSTLLYALPGNEISIIFDAVLDAIFRISRIFPPLSGEITLLLSQLGKLLCARLGAQTFLTFGCGQNSIDSKNGVEFSENFSNFDCLESSLLSKLRSSFNKKMCESVLFNEEI